MDVMSARLGVQRIDMFDLYSLGLAVLVAHSTNHWTDGALVLLAYGAIKAHSRSHLWPKHPQHVDRDDGAPEHGMHRDAYNVLPSNAPPEVRMDQFPPVDGAVLFARPRPSSGALHFPTLGYSPHNQVLPWYARQVRSPAIQWGARMNFANTARYN
jgi:hypothetical protein